MTYKVFGGTFLLNQSIIDIWFFTLTKRRHGWSVHECFAYDALQLQLVYSTAAAVKCVTGTGSGNAEDVVLFRSVLRDRRRHPEHANGHVGSRIVPDQRAVSGSAAAGDRRSHPKLSTVHTKAFCRRYFHLSRHSCLRSSLSCRRRKHHDRPAAAAGRRLATENDAVDDIPPPSRKLVSDNCRQFRTVIVLFLQSSPGYWFLRKRATKFGEKSR